MNWPREFDDAVREERERAAGHPHTALGDPQDRARSASEEEPGPLSGGPVELMAHLDGRIAKLGQMADDAAKDGHTFDCVCSTERQAELVELKEWLVSEAPLGPADNDRGEPDGGSPKA